MRLYIPRNIFYLAQITGRRYCNSEYVTYLFPYHPMHDKKDMAGTVKLSFYQAMPQRWYDRAAYLERFNYGDLLSTHV